VGPNTGQTNRLTATVGKTVDCSRGIPLVLNSFRIACQCLFDRLVIFRTTLIASVMHSETVDEKFVVIRDFQFLFLKLLKVLLIL
jgi:hypothetical protein